MNSRNPNRPYIFYDPEALDKTLQTAEPDQPCLTFYRTKTGKVVVGTEILPYHIANGRALFSFSYTRGDPDETLGTLTAEQLKGFDLFNYKRMEEYAAEIVANGEEKAPQKIKDFVPPSVKKSESRTEHPVKAKQQSCVFYDAEVLEKSLKDAEPDQACLTIYRTKKGKIIVGNDVLPYDKGIRRAMALPFAITRSEPEEILGTLTADQLKGCDPAHFQKLDSYANEVMTGGPKKVSLKIKDYNFSSEMEHKRNSLLSRPYAYCVFYDPETLDDTLKKAEPDQPCLTIYCTTNSKIVVGTNLLTRKEANSRAASDPSYKRGTPYKEVGKLTAKQLEDCDPFALQDIESFAASLINKKQENPAPSLHEYLKTRPKKTLPATPMKQTSLGYVPHAPASAPAKNMVMTEPETLQHPTEPQNPKSFFDIEADEIAASLKEASRGKISETPTVVPEQKTTPPGPEASGKNTFPDTYRILNPYPQRNGKRTSCSGHEQIKSENLSRQRITVLTPPI